MLETFISYRSILYITLYGDTIIVEGVMLQKQKKPKRNNDFPTFSAWKVTKRSFNIPFSMIYPVLQRDTMDRVIYEDGADTFISSFLKIVSLNAFQYLFTLEVHNMDG